MRICVSSTLAFSIVFLALPTIGTAQTVFVDDNAPPGGDGISWNTAFRFLQDALNAAQLSGAVEIRVAEGQYVTDRSNANPSGTGDRNAVFQLLSGVALRGGYAGLGTSDPDQHSPAIFPTVLNGDLLGNDIGDIFTNTGDNGFHVVRAESPSSGTVLEGFITRGGRSFGFSPELRGGGLLCHGGEMSVQNCVFELNAGDDAGGLFAANSSITLSNCTFRNNRGSRGGGAWIDGPGSPQIEHCDFVDNIGGFGCGLQISNQAAARVNHCSFRANIGQISTQSGGELYIAGADALVVGCNFEENVVTGGGGGLFTLDCNPLIVNSTFRDNIGRFDLGDALHLRGGQPRFWNCSFFMGPSESIGNAHALVFESAAEFRNCTFFKTGTDTFSVGFLAQNETISLYNSIVWGHRFTGHPNDEAQVFTIRSLPSTLDIRSSIIEGWTGSLGGSNNSGTNPGLMTRDKGVLLLTAGSPAIDRGDNSLVPLDEADLDEDGNTAEPLSLDLLGHPRITDDLDSPDAGIGAPPLVDLGAHEFQNAAIPTVSEWGFLALALLITTAGTLLTKRKLNSSTRVAASFDQYLRV